MLLGEAGVGKTFLLHAALAHSDLQDLKTVHVWYPKLALPDTFKMICRELGLPEGTYDAGNLAHALHRALLAEHEHGRQVVLVIDEAHTIPVDILESLLRLGNFTAFTGEPLLQIVLVGLPVLWRHFSAPPLRPFKHRMVTRVQLAPLTYRESLAYIRHHLQQAGARADTVFAPGAVRQVARSARGNPRVMNGLCTHMLIAGFGARQKPISAHLAQNVITAYGAQRSHPGWWWGVAAAASILAVAGMMDVFPSTSQMVSQRGPSGLRALTRSLSDGSGVETAQPPAARGASPSGPSLGAPRLQQREPVLPAVAPRLQQREPVLPARAESTPGRAVGQAPDEGHVRLVPLESRERQRLEPPPSSLPPRVTPTPSATPMGKARKSCDELKAEIQAKLDAKRLTGYALTIMAREDFTGQQIVGSCEGNTKKIALNRVRHAP
jgi:type II secretory pathway predicted ATPase ExeA